MTRFIEKDDTVHSFDMDQGTKTISKKPAESGYVNVADYSAPLKKNDLVTLANTRDYTVKKATAGDVVLGRITRIPKPKINEDFPECQVDVFGDLKELPLFKTNAAIKPTDNIKLTVTGADKGTATSLFISLEARKASDDKEVIDVFLPQAGKLD